MTDSTMTKEFRLTIHHDDDCDSPMTEGSLFKAHSFSTRHVNFTDPDLLLGCEYESDVEDSDYYHGCGELPTNHSEISDHDWRGPEGYFLSYFEHGSCRWGLQGSMSGMPDFQWDGAEYAGFLEVVVSNDEREWWDGRPEEDKLEAAKATIEEYTDWCNGECYGYILERINAVKCDRGYVHEEDNENLDSCWGFIGFKYFQEEVRAVTHFSGATEETTEIVDEAFGATGYGRFFYTEEEKRKVEEEEKRRIAAREGISL